MKNFGVNWKTTGAGIGVIASAVISLWHGSGFSGDTVAAIIGGLGLIFAKDGNVSGGNKFQ